jgi:predicted dehydrogenase
MQPAAAIIGSGFIAPIHIEALARLGVPVVGILGSAPARSERLAQAWNLRNYANVDALLNDERVSVVHVTAPNRYHAEYTKALLAAGKHVLCEKPLALTSAESQDLVARATTSGCVAGVAYNVRYYPHCLDARARIRGGDAGVIHHISGSYAQDWLLENTDYNWRVLCEEGGQLRAVADIGTHWMDLLQFITGHSIESVCADLRTVHETRFRPAGEVATFANDAAGNTVPVPIRTDDFGAILLRFSGGVPGVCWVSQVSAGSKNRIEFQIAGARHGLSWCSERPEELTVGRRGRPNEIALRDPALLHSGARAFSDYPGGHCEGYPDTFKQLFRDFYAYIAAGDYNAPRNFPTFEDGHRELLVCDAILQSHRERRWVDVATLEEACL